MIGRGNHANSGYPVAKGQQVDIDRLAQWHSRNDERTTMPPEKKSRHDFHLEEYKALRSEVIAQGAKYDQAKLIALGGLGTLYAWIFSNLVILDKQVSCTKLDNLTTAMVLLIPLWLSWIIGKFGTYILYSFEKVGTYLRCLEVYSGETHLGWEKFSFLSIRLTHPRRRPGRAGARCGPRPRRGARRWCRAGNGGRSGRRSWSGTIGRASG